MTPTSEPSTDRTRDGVVDIDPATGTTTRTTDGTTDDTTDGTVEVLPWFHSTLNLVSALVAVAVLAAGIGWVVGNNRALPDPNDTDIGFLQDMRVHHEQAVQMALIYLRADDRDPNLSTIAREILVGQNIEIGRFIQLLRSFGASEVNETDIAMTWMDESVPLDRMPGMATEDDLRALADADGGAADELFVTLMTAHHQGGVHMAEHAVDHAATDEVRLMAGQIARVQLEEITELARLLVLSRA